MQQNLSRPSAELDTWLARVEALAGRIAGEHDAIERDRRLSPGLVAALAEAGLFRMWLPAELGGHDVAPPVALRVITAAARLNGSVGWCLGPGNVSSLFSAYLPQAAARHVYGGDWHVNAAGSLAGKGRAEPVEGGFRLSGRWAFCTNSIGCPWYLGIFTVMDGEAPRRLPDGTPDARFFFFPAERAEVLPTWDTGGLRGTASNDIALTEAVVGVSYGFGAGAVAWPASPIYAAGPKLWPGAAFAAVALGIAEEAVDALAGLAQTRVPTMGSAPLRDNAVLRDGFARAEVALAAARGHFFAEVDECWAALQAARAVSRAQAARLGQACSHLADTAREVTQIMYRLGGGASVYRACALDRCLRDVQVAAQHASVGPRQFDEAARVRLGLPHA